MGHNVVQRGLTKHSRYFERWTVVRPIPLVRSEYSCTKPFQLPDFYRLQYEKSIKIWGVGKARYEATCVCVCANDLVMYSCMYIHVLV